MPQLNEECIRLKYDMPKYNEWNARLMRMSSTKLGYDRLKMLNKNCIVVNHVIKILRSLSKKWRRKVTTILTEKNMHVLPFE